MAYWNGTQIALELKVDFRGAPIICAARNRRIGAFSHPSRSICKWAAQAESGPIMRIPSVQKIGYIATLALVSIGSPAQATDLTAKQILADFNLVASGNVTTQSDIEGAAVVGGTLNGSTFFNNTNDLPASKTIYLYGSLGHGPLNLDNGGNLNYSGNITNSQVNFNGGGQQFKSFPSPISAYTTPLNQMSTILAGLTPTAGASIVDGTFKANGATGLIVFDLTASQLESDLQNSQISFVGDKGVTGYIINVTGNFSEPSSTNFNTAQQDALFNFVDATSVSLGNWKASVLAPDASLQIENGYLDGSVYVENFSGGGELHNDNLYNGALPSAPSVPEAPTWMMLLTGFGMLGLGLRKSQRTADQRTAHAPS